jgi:hypothetical protein
VAAEPGRDESGAGIEEDEDESGGRDKKEGIPAKAEDEDEDDEDVEVDRMAGADQVLTSTAVAAALRRFSSSINWGTRTTMAVRSSWNARRDLLASRSSGRLAALLRMLSREGLTPRTV